MIDYFAMATNIQGTINLYWCWPNIAWLIYPDLWLRGYIVRQSLVSVMIKKPPLLFKFKALNTIIPEYDLAVAK